MIVADIIGALGNQLFSYAATKAIALDLGYEYRYRVVPPSCAIVTKPNYNSEGSYVDKIGQEYNEYFEKAFYLNTNERIDVIPPTIKSEWVWKRFPTTNYNRDVYNISDNTHLIGFYLQPKYFEHRRTEVLRWFRFQNSYLDKCRNEREKIIKLTGASHLVSIHIRCGKAFRLARMSLDASFHKKAMQRVKEEFSNENICFILFSDVPDEARRLLRTEDIIMHTGTMFEDLCLMTLCDSHIVVNSTFSWWGAWLSDWSTGMVIRPSIWPASDKGTFAPLDIFPSEWIVVDARQKGLTPRVFLQRIRDEYSPLYVKCADNPVWYERFIIRPLSSLKKLLEKSLPIMLVCKLKSLRKLRFNTWK